MDPRYPIGKYDWPATLDAAARDAAIGVLEALPAMMRDAVAGLSDAQLDTPYRDGGWTVRQTVHHTADSHMHSYTRFKFALSEENPTIKPYAEQIWAEFEDAKLLPVEPSLRILEGVHERLVRFLRSFNEAAFARQFFHPENGPMRLDVAAGLYSWHSRHHVAHITELRRRTGW